MGCLLGEAPGAHDLPLLWPAGPHVCGGSQLARHPPPCSLSEASWDMAPGLGAAAAAPPGVGSGGGGGSVGLPRQPAASVVLSSHPGLAGGEAASLHTLGGHRWVVWGAPGPAGGSVSSAGQLGPAAAAWGRRGLLKSDGGTGGPAGWG